VIMQGRPRVLPLMREVLQAIVLVIVLRAGLVSRLDGRRGRCWLSSLVIWGQKYPPQPPPGLCLRRRGLGPHPLYAYVGCLYLRGWPAAWTPHP
jgi:hypothetical protein